MAMKYITPPIRNDEGAERAPKIPPVDMKAKAIVNATVALVKCSTSVLEKCHIDPLCTGIL